MQQIGPCVTITRSIDRTGRTILSLFGDDKSEQSKQNYLWQKTFWPPLLLFSHIWIKCSVFRGGWPGARSVGIVDQLLCVCFRTYYNWHGSHSQQRQHRRQCPDHSFTTFQSIRSRSGWMADTYKSMRPLHSRYMYKRRIYSGYCFRIRGL